ncbi:MAG: thioesterase family protein [Cardiobacteriaceae bacterium]|nr:thioesterase family protein [Cardiobacteriaceae bacterium]
MNEVITHLDVRVGDINYGGHLGHDRLITLLHQARIDFLHSLGASELDCFGTGLIMRRLACEYQGEAFLGDRLTFTMRVVKHRRTAFTLYYAVRCGERLIATAETEMVAFDYKQHKVMMLPEAFNSALQHLGGILV